MEPLFQPDLEAVVESDEELKSVDLAAIFADHAEEESTPPSGFVISLTHGTEADVAGCTTRASASGSPKFELCGEQEPEGYL